MSNKKRMDAIEFRVIANEEVEDIEWNSRWHKVGEEVYLADYVISRSGTYEVEILQIDKKCIYVVINKVVHIFSELTLYEKHREIIGMLHE